MRAISNINLIDILNFRVIGNKAKKINNLVMIISSRQLFKTESAVIILFTCSYGLHQRAGVLDLELGCSLAKLQTLKKAPEKWVIHSNR